RYHSTIPPEYFYPNANVSKPEFRSPFYAAPTSATLPDPEVQPRALPTHVTTASIAGVPQSFNSQSSEQHQSPACGTTSIQAPTPKGLPADDVSAKFTHSTTVQQASDEVEPNLNSAESDDYGDDGQRAQNPALRASNSPSPIQQASDTTMAGALPQGYSHTLPGSSPQASSDVDIIFSDDGDDVSSVSTSPDDPSADDARAIRERAGCDNDDSSIIGSSVVQVPTLDRRKKTLDRRYHTEPLGSPPKLADVVKRSLKRMRKPLATLLNDVNPNQAAVHMPGVAIESQQTGTQAVAPASGKKKKMTAAQRYRLQPEQEAKVPFAQRRSDAELIQIGQLTDAYTRHYLAPYAFLYIRGRLHQDYVRLADKRDGNGQPVFSDTVTRRLFGETTANRRIEAQRIALQRQGNVIP
ncbi:MAG: hypothetical protein Q9183_006376, partial [Haloplaca sp. 2 TL-2023]